MIFNEKKENNSPSWSIKTEFITKECNITTNTTEIIRITAVDTYTGAFLCSLVEFREGLPNIIYRNAKVLLEKYGYDPYQHKTEFSPDTGGISFEVK